MRRRRKRQRAREGSFVSDRFLSRQKRSYSGLIKVGVFKRRISIYPPARIFCWKMQLALLVTSMAGNMPHSMGFLCGKRIAFCGFCPKKGNFMRARRYDWQVAISGTEQGLKLRKLKKSTIH